jgi:hypothetical protein
MTIVPLSTSYPCRIGGPTLSSVDTAMFSLRYFQHCMACTFCHDDCCKYGVDVDLDNVARLKATDEKFKARIGYPEDQWFTSEVVADAEFPSGQHVRTQVRDGACVFRDRIGRGCLIHSYCLEEGLDYRSLKPMVSILFPLTFDYGLLHVSNEAFDGSLICSGSGPTCYQGARDELIYYFGAALARELDALQNGQ